MEKKKRYAVIFLTVLLSAALMIPSQAVSYDKVASSSDMTTVEQVGMDGLIPVFAEDVEDGTYEVSMECSSSMFRIDRAQLTVADGAMELSLYLASESYSRLFCGTAEQAAASTEDQYVSYREEGEARVFSFPVEALDQPFSCAAFSVNKEMWYDRTLLVRADSLPEGSLKVEIADYDALKEESRKQQILQQKEQNELDKLAVEVDLEDGEYELPAALEGGSGRATVTSPATLIVREGKAFARIQWSSPHYDYMIVEEHRVLPENAGTGENSVFTIPVTEADGTMKVIADTTAMSTPHEIEYTLNFDMPGLKDGHRWIWLLIGLIVLTGLGCIVWIKRKNRKS